MSKTWLGAGAVVSAIVLFVAVNVIGDVALRGQRIDLTQQGLYTLSDGTERVLAGIEEPITLQFFFSEELSADVPTIRDYARRVEDMLRTYADKADGQLILEVVDPTPFSPAEDRAVAAGLQGAPVDDSGATFYFGLAASNTVGDREVVPFFQSENEPFLEYDLTRMIRTLSVDGKPVIGLMTPLPVDGADAGGFGGGGGGLPAWVFVENLAQLFDVRRIGIDVTDIPAEVDVLVALHPAGLDEATLYALDQFVLRGGRLIAFVDPHSEAAGIARRIGQQLGLPPVGTSSDLGLLFSHWGVAYDPDVFVGDLLSAQRVTAGQGAQRRATEYLAWLRLGPERFDTADPAIGQLTQVNMGTAGAIALAEGSPFTLMPLMRSSAESQLIETVEVAVNPNPEGLLQDFVADADTHVLAGRLSAPALTTAFPDGRPERPAPEGTDAVETAGDTADTPAHLAEAAGPVNVLVVADSDMLDNAFWVNTQNFFGQQISIPIADNATMAINAIELAAGGDALIGLRSRGRSDRPFTAVEEIRKLAEAEFQAQEQALTERLTELEEQLAALEQQGGDGALVTAEQDAAIAEFRTELLATRGELRQVQLNLNQDIDRLAAWVQFVNIGLMPLALVGVAIVLAWSARRRRARAALAPLD